VETLEAMRELESGGGKVFQTTAGLFADWGKLGET
jgi:hypothetical protein